MDKVILDSLWQSSLGKLDLFHLAEFGVFSVVSAFMDHMVQPNVVWCCLGPSSSVVWIDGASIKMFDTLFLVDLLLMLKQSNLGNFGYGIF